MFETILVFLLGALAAILTLAARQPGGFHYTRSQRIFAPPQTVFAQVNDFHKWKAWSPWAKIDPHAKNVFEGPASGEGAIFRWSGNRHIGEGNMTIIESHPPGHIKIRLQFLRPFRATHTAEFNFSTDGNTTYVTWSMYGQNTLIGKVMNLMINCEQILNRQFEQGLAQLKAVAEKT